MTKRFASLTSSVLLALGIAAFTGSALAGNGNGNSAPPGQVKNDAAATTQTQGSADQNAGTQPGVKPTDATAKGNKPTMCSTGGGQGSSATCTASGSNAATAQTAAKSDQSKRYGNGKTAAQIANARGAPAGTKVYGPGNSQPHKVWDCRRQQWVDVHAVKSYTTSCASSPTATSGSTASTSHSNTSSSSNTVSSSSHSSSPAAPKPTVSGNVLGTAAATAKGASATGNAPAGGVLGATASAGKSGPAGGVLGAVASGTLPFTGFPVWYSVLAALALIVLGTALLRRGRATV